MNKNGTQTKLMLAESPKAGADVGVSLATGLSIWHGSLDEEYLTQLRPTSKAIKVFTEMADDAVIGAMLESITTPLMASKFEVHVGGESDEDKAAAEFLEKNLFEMSDMTWREHAEEMLDFVTYGFSLAEKVLEKRDDGRLWLKSLMPVGQDTLDRWGDVDELGRVKSFTQRDNEGKTRTASMDKLLHFTLNPRKRNPEGRSLLRGLYRPWYFKKNLEAIEAIGAERDVGNAPIATLGEGYYSTQDITNLKASLEGLRMDEALYLLLPHGIEVKAFGAGGKTYDIRAMIRDYQHIMRQVFFADFLSLGSEQVGTQALAKELTTFFSLALTSIQNRMLEIWNNQLVKWLFDFNDFNITKLPQLGWTKPGTRNIQSISQAYATLVNTNILTPDGSIETQIREEAGLPPLSPELTEKKAQLMEKNIKDQLEAPSPQDQLTAENRRNGPGSPSSEGATIQADENGFLKIFNVKSWWKK